MIINSNPRTRLLAAVAAASFAAVLLAGCAATDAGGSSDPSGGSRGSGSYQDPQSWQIAMASCLTDAGYPTSSDGFQFSERGVDPAADKAYDDCLASVGSSPIGTPIPVDPAESERMQQLVLDCLDEAGYPTTMNAERRIDSTGIPEDVLLGCAGDAG